MKKQGLFSVASFIIAAVSSLSLIAATSLPKELLDSLEEDLSSFSSDAEDLEDYNTLMSGADIIVDAADSDLYPPFEESEPNIEDQEKSATTPNLQPDVKKVLYESNMNYGTGAPVPKPAPLNTVTRNLIVLGTSTVLATIAMLVVSSNKGLDAPKR